MGYVFPRPLKGRVDEEESISPFPRPLEVRSITEGKNFKVGHIGHFFPVIGYTGKKSGLIMAWIGQNYFRIKYTCFRKM